MCVCHCVGVGSLEREYRRKKARSAKELKQGRRGKLDLPQLASFGGIKVPSLLPFFPFVEFLGLFMDFQVGMMSYGLDLKL